MRIRFLVTFFALAVSAAAQQTAPVQKTMPGNSVTGDLTFGSSRTVTFLSGSTLNINSGVTVTGIPTATAASSALGALSPTANTIPYFTSSTAASLLTMPSSAIVGISDSQTLSNKTLSAPTISGGIVFPADTQQVFSPGANNAGLNVGSVSSDPATPANGGLWYNSTSNNLYARINGSNVPLGVTGGGTVTSIGMSVPTGFSISGTPITTSGTLAVTLTGSVTWPSNTRQTFAPGLSSSGLNVGTVTSDPSSPTNGDIWYNSTTPALNARINGATVNLGATGSGNVAGAASSTTHHLVTFADTTGKTIEDFSTITTSSSGTLTGSAAIGLTSTGANNIVLTPGSGFVQVGPYSSAAAANSLLQVSGSTSASIGVVSFGSAGDAFIGFAAGGTSGSPSGVASGTFLVYLGGSGYNGSAWTGSKALVGEYSAENWTSGANGAYITLETTPTGSTTRAERVRASAQGNLLVGTTSDTGLTGVGGLSVASTTDASSSTAGAAVISGGLAVAKKIINASSILSTSSSGGIGYTTGSGGTVTQATSRTTGVTLNTVSGAITLFSAAGTATPTTFTISDSAVAATDTIIPNQISGTDSYEIFITGVSAGSFKVMFIDATGTTTEQPVFKFNVIKGSNS